MVKTASSTAPRPRRRYGDIARFLLRALDPVSASWLSAALFIVSFGGLAASMAPLALKGVVDELAAGGPGAAVRLTPLIGLYVAALLFQRICEQAQTFAYSTGEQRLVRRFGGRSFAHMLALPLGYHVDEKSGALAQSLTEGLLGLRLILTHLALSVAPVLVQLGVAGLVLSSVLGGAIGLALFAALAAYGAVFTWGVFRLHGAVKGVSAAQINVGGAIADSLMNVEAIKAYTAERRFTARYDHLLGLTEARWRDFYRHRFQNGLAVAAVFGVSVGAIHLMAGRQVAGGAMTLGAFVLINSYLLQLVRPLEALGFAIRDLGQGMAYLDKLTAILSHPAEGAGQGHDEAQVSADPASLEFSHVSFAFGARTTLTDVSFRIEPGTTVGVVGPSGAGKSSLLRLILRFYAPMSGCIRLDGRDIASLPLETVRRQIALVSQDTILFNDTIAENIALAGDDPDPEAIASAAELARLSEFLALLPEGLQTRVGERGLKLSGGEKQRVSIARAALKGARLVILDEATAALDPQTEKAVWATLTGLSRGSTTLVVTHRLSTIAGADNILVLDQGRVVEQGVHAALLARNGLYARLWRAQAVEAPQSAVGAND